MSSAWQTVDIFVEEDGTATAYVATNDDNDDGQDDRKITEWNTKHPSLAAALKQYGTSRIGVSGIEVQVYVNGQEQKEATR